MSNFYQHISQLVWRHGVASVPGVGVFTAERRSARFDGGILHAPYMAISFEACADTDGQALISSICRKDGVDAAQARAFMLDGVREMKAALAKGATVAIPQVGTLTADADSDALCFEPLASPCAASIRVEPLEIRKTVPTDGEIDLAAAALQSRREALARSLRRTASSAAAIAVFALLVFIVSQLPSRVSSDRQTASVATLPLSLPADEPLIAQPGASEPALVLILNTPADASGPAKKRRERTEQPSNTPGRYCLVVASLASQTEAETFIKAHSTTELPLSLLAQDGRWRVYALSAPSQEELGAVARNIGVYELYPSAWICRR
ncbi:MAG: hypothetical protein NC418_06925 [Muribaculaceae bacterium]|nr:hypothetical protein [Muribaculaceae bacterium]